MGDDLRRRRTELWQELREIENSLAQADAAPPSFEVWSGDLPGTSEFLLLVDADLTIRAINRTQPGLPDPVGRSALDFIPAAYHETLHGSVSQALKHLRPMQFELAGAGPDGTESWYSTWVFPLPHKEGGPVAALLSADITSHRRIVAAIEQERGLLQALVADAPDFIAIIDAEHRVQMLNRVDHGLNETDVLGKAVEELVPVARKSEIRACIDQVLRTGKPGAYVTEVLSPDGIERWFHVRVGPIKGGDGHVARVSLVSREITDDVMRERQLGEERESLRTSEARYRTLIDYAPEALVVFDTESDRFVDANKNACLLFGLPREALLQQNPESLSPPKQADGSPSERRIKERVDAVLAGKQQSFEWLHKNAQGETFPCEVRLVRLPDPKRVLVRGSIIDISERKRAEAKHDELTALLIHSQKVQAIGQLTGGIAHDFNNLLTVIVNCLEMIQLDAAKDGEIKLNAEQGLEAAKRAGELTQALLAFARRQPLRPRPVSLNRLVSGLEPLLRRTLGETIAIETVLGGGLWSCEVDPGQLESALLNLALNARDAMPGGGKLTIETANTKLDREYARNHDEVEPGQYAMLAVTDSGTGMAPDVLERAFDPFFTTKGVGRGSGLGLSSVFGFVKQSGGHVKIYSEVGEGTTVRLYLPRSHKEPDLQGPLAVFDAAPTGKGQLVLMVEDEPSVRTMVLRMLERLNYRCIAAHNADDALAALRKAPDVDLLLTDVVLPGDLNGARLAAMVRETHPDLPVVYMSGYTENAIIHHGRLDPGVQLLEKPFSQLDLALCLAQMLNDAG